jgi:dTDP-4-amino-4,6-dideoxygalactose transaminase
LEAKGIATRQGTHAPVILGYYAEKYDVRLETFPNAYLADRIGLTLPLYPQMTDEEQATVLSEMRHAFGGR